MTPETVTETPDVTAPQRPPAGQVIQREPSLQERHTAAVSRSAIARAAASEQLFWLRAAVILLVAGAIGWLGIVHVEHRSAGLRTAHEVAQVHDQLRERVEVNRRLAAQLTGKKDPVQLADEAKRKLHMHSPEARGRLEVR